MDRAAHGHPRAPLRDARRRRQRSRRERRRRALTDAGLDAASSTSCSSRPCASDEITPAAAPIVAHELGARARGGDRRRRGLHRLDRGPRARRLLDRGRRAQHVLVIGAEILSRFIDFDDRRTAPLFGDGAGAMVVSRRRRRADRPVRVRQRRRARRGDPITARQAGRSRWKDTRPSCRPFTGSARAPSRCVGRAGLTLDDVDLFVYHQANSRILAAVAERLELPASGCSTASPSSATRAPRACRWRSSLAVEAGALQPGARVVLGAIGAGLSWGVTVVDWGGS